MKKLRKRKKKNQNYINQKYINIFKKREKESKNYIENCLKEKLIDKKKYNSIEKPLISVVLPSFNKEKVLMKSIRSIQNQSFKNVEIIIVDDCSRDNSKHYYNYLLKTEPRIRIFTHLKNMGVWRTRIDGVLYSRGKYIIHFDTGDLYSDEYVLEDAYNLVEKYNLDSIRMLFKMIDSYDHANNKIIPNFPINGEYNKIVYEKDNIKEYNQQIFTYWGTLWTRLAKAEIFIKGLYLLSSSILNIHKNLWEDIWWNKIIDQVSYNLLIVNRYSYLYLNDAKGVGTIKNKTLIEKDNMIQEFIYFLYFDLELLPKNDNKKSIINQLKKYTNKNENINLQCLKSKFYILDNLLSILLKDPYISHKDKIFLRKELLNNKRKK